MTQEDKDLLLKDICARLPYGVKCLYFDPEVGTDWVDRIEYIYPFDLEVGVDQWIMEIDAIKPYLLPLSSMTEAQKDIYCQLQQKVIYNSKGVVTEDVMNYVNWCYENHLDINDLIPKGLALDATNLNIYENQS